MLRIRENEMKKMTDMESIVINGEKTRVSEKERELDRKIREAEQRALVLRMRSRGSTKETNEM
jgi:hypothetical protein